MTEKIKEQILAIRDSGVTNMFDIKTESSMKLTSATSTNWLFIL